MSVAGGRTRAVAALFYSILILQIWVCLQCNNEANATRVFPGFHNQKNDTTSFMMKSRRKSSEVVEELFEKFLNGTKTDIHNYSNDNNGKSFDDNKRRVPSCPDPLHN
ncbi:hypothetical protein CsatB_022036 [Cannabis sativa]